MKKKIALGLVMCMVGLSILGCGGDTPTDTPSAAPTATPFPQPTGSLAVCTQWLNKIHLGDSYEQVRQAVGKEPRLVSAGTLFYDIDSFADCGCDNKLTVTFNENIEADGENKELTVERILLSTVIVNEHVSGEGKVDAMDAHMAEWEDYLVELYGQHTSIKGGEYTATLTWEGEALEDSAFEKIDLESSSKEGPNENPGVHVTFE